MILSYYPTAPAPRPLIGSQATASSASRADQSLEQFLCAAPVTVANLSGVTTVSAGGRHTCALADGAVSCWGRNEFGQLGDGTALDSAAPVAVVGLPPGIRSLSAGGWHTCAATDRDLSCWGYDGTQTLSSPQMLIPMRTISGLPAPVPQLSCGSNGTCAVTQSSSALCWGANNNGAVGDGSYDPRPAPTAVSGLDSGMVGISTGKGDGASTSCAVSAHGHLWCWGDVLLPGASANTPIEIVLM